MLVKEKFVGLEPFPLPKVVKKKAVIVEPKTTPVHNMYSALERDDMEVGELFLRPATKA